MKAEELLLSLRRIQENIDRKLRIKQWHLRQLNSDVPPGPARAAQLRQSSRRLSTMIAQDYKQYNIRVKSCARLINRLPDKTERDLLRCHYLSGMRLEEVAEQLNFSERHCYRLREKALDRLDALMNR